MGWHHSEQSKEKIRAALTGRRLSKEHKAKLSQAHLGTRCSEETKEKMRRAHIGKRHSEEAKAKIGKANFKGDVVMKQTGRWRAEKLFPCPKGYVRHHIDGNTLNNSPDNIQVLSNSEHTRFHNFRRKGLTVSRAVDN